MKTTLQKKTAQKLPPGNPAYRGWPTPKRYREAARLVVQEEWSRNKAAAELGISRSRFIQWLNSEEGAVVQARLEYEKKQADVAGKVSEASVRPLGLMENRRVGTIHEFVDRYFTWLICPDCGVHHEVPHFHREIWEALQDPECTRVLVNLPPYHGKSFCSVIDTVYDICKNPNSRTIMLSQSSAFARLFTSQVTELLTNQELYGDGPNLVRDWGPFNDGSTKWTQEEVFVAGRISAEKDPTLLSLGVGNQIYGRRADKIKADDVATLKNQANPDQVLKLIQYLDQEAASRIGTRGKLAFLGTRVHPNDIYPVYEQRQGYKVLKYPCIIDEVTGRTLWPEHFTYDAAVARRDEMRPEHFQLIYQQVALPGASADFTVEAIDSCKNVERGLTQCPPNLRLIAGLDLAGGTQDSGFTAGVLLGLDVKTGVRYLIDLFNEKSMRAPKLKEKIFDWTDQYGIYLWKVERNGIQSQLVQYNEDIIRYLAAHGTRVEGHHTGQNKWDPEFGVSSMSPLFSAGLVDIPWGNSITQQRVQPLIDQLLAFPLGAYSDLVMAFWFAELGCRQLLKRGHLPLFSDRPVPPHVARRRVVFDFAANEVHPISVHAQVHEEDPLRRKFQRLLTGRVGHRKPRVVMEPEDRSDFEKQGYVNILPNPDA